MLNNLCDIHTKECSAAVKELVTEPHALIWKDVHIILMSKEVIYTTACLRYPGKWISYLSLYICLRSSQSNENDRHIQKANYGIVWYMGHREEHLRDLRKPSQIE